MYELTIEKHFSAAHQLRGYGGKCERMHGHNWKIQVHVVADKLNELDLAIDFHDLKRLTEEVIAPLDHSFLNEMFPFTEKNPSSENISKWIFDTLNKKIDGQEESVQLTAVTVWESETASATYYEE
jgi:6-pyruvoyltetrahydropterin/6-carboxytetrahydropterin synthase